MQTGIIKKIISLTKNSDGHYEGGYGFISMSSGADVFFHGKGVKQPLSFKDLKEGDSVEFMVEETNKGYSAYDLTLLNS